MLRLDRWLIWVLALSMVPGAVRSATSFARMDGQAAVPLLAKRSTQIEESLLARRADTTLDQLIQAVMEDGCHRDGCADVDVVRWPENSHDWRRRPDDVGQRPRSLPAGWTCAGDLEVLVDGQWRALYDTGPHDDILPHNSGLITDIGIESIIRLPLGGLCLPSSLLDEDRLVQHLYEHAG